MKTYFYLREKNKNYSEAKLIMDDEKFNFESCVVLECKFDNDFKYLRCLIEKQVEQDDKTR